MLLALTLTLAAVVPPTFLAPGDVRSAAVFELNVRTPTRAATKELAIFLRTFGLVAHLPLFTD